MKKFKRGIKKAFAEIIGGIIIAPIINAFATTGLLPMNLVVLINVIGTIVLILSMRSWGFFFAVGWLAGFYIFFSSGLLQPLDIFLYIVLPVTFLVVRVCYWIKIASK